MHVLVWTGWDLVYAVVLVLAFVLGTVLGTWILDLMPRLEPNVKCTGQSL